MEIHGQFHCTTKKLEGQSALWRWLWSGELKNKCRSRKDEREEILNSMQYHGQFHCKTNKLEELGESGRSLRKGDLKKNTESTDMEAHIEGFYTN